MTEEETKTDEEEETSGSSEEGGESEEKKEKAERDKKEAEEAKELMEKLEEDPPDKLEDWPGGKAMFETFGGADAETDYEEAATSKLGPSNLRRFSDGSIEVDGEPVDDPEQYKGEPIPGGPTDPDAPPEPGEDRGDEEAPEDKGDGDDAGGDSDDEKKSSGDGDEDDKG